MRRDSEKHKRIVRSRIIAVCTVTVLGLALLVLLSIGLIKASAAFRKFTGEPDTETAHTEETEETEETEVFNIADTDLSVPSEEEKEDTAKPAEDLEEQYDSVLEDSDSGAGALEIEEIVNGMSLEEKVAQLFFVRPEQLTNVATVTRAGDATKAALQKYHVGGIIYFSKNLIDPDQTRELLKNTKEFAAEDNGIPLFLGVDEEGGSVTRLADNPEFGIENTGTMESIGKSGDSDNAFDAGKQIGGYLKDYGFNLDFAPVADVSVPGSAIGDRSFGSDPYTVSVMADRYSDGLRSAEIIPVYKHFPGFGRAMENTDNAAVSIDVGIDEIKDTDLKPYTSEKIGSDRMIMAGNMSFPNISGDKTPACMSEMIIRDYLRGELKFNGVVITDGLDAAAIRDNYDSGAAAVNALKAGVDMLLCPADFEAAYNAVLSGAESGELKSELIDGAVSRILTLKSRTIGLS